MPTQESIDAIADYIKSLFADDLTVKVTVLLNGPDDLAWDGPRDSAATDKTNIEIVFDPTSDAGEALGRRGTEARRETGVFLTHEMVRTGSGSEELVRVGRILKKGLLLAIRDQLLNNNVHLDQDVIESDKGLRRSGGRRGKFTGVTRLWSYSRSYIENLDET